MIKLKKYIITKEEYEATKAMAKLNQHKRIDKRLQVILMRYEGKTDNEIGQALKYSYKRVSQLCAEFKKDGLEKYAKLKYKGNHRSMSIDEEEKILKDFDKKAEEGQIVTAQDIKAAFDKKLGRDTGRGYIYMLLARNNWRMVMPRGKHPKKASEAEIEASKKLTLHIKS